MRSIATALLSLLLAFPGAAAGQSHENAWPPPPLDCYFSAAGPARVIDGDTLEVPSCYGTTRVRLLGIDAPERGEAGAAEATEAVERMLAPSGVAFCLCARGVRRKTSARDCEADRYGRIIAVCTDANGRDLARALIRAGLAKARYGCQYAEEHREACAARRALWTGGGECAPRCEWRGRHER